MSIKLYVKTDALKTKAAEVESQIKRLEQQFDAIQDIVARSSGYWVGISGDKARKEFNSQKENTSKVIRRFREHPTDLLTMAGIYEEGERETTARSKALDTDIIK